MDKIQNHNIKNLLNVVLLVIILATLPVEVLAQQIDEQARKRAKELVAQMTLKEKIDYLSGETSFSLRAIPRLGIPGILLADGPCGTRNHSEHSTLYPCGILTAATWNRDMAYLLEKAWEMIRVLVVLASCWDPESIFIVLLYADVIMNILEKIHFSHRKSLANI